MVQNASSNRRDGLTWRSLIGILYPLIVMQPASIWLYLTTGNMLSASPYITLLLFVWIAKYLGSPLSKQESFIIYAVGAALSGEILVFLGFINGMWFRNSPIAKTFGIAEIIPEWCVPKNPYLWTRRTFLDPSWATPILLALFFSFLAKIVDVSIGFITYRMFVEVEKLPFPMARVSAEVITTLIEEETKKKWVLMISMLIAMIYSIMVHATPILSGSPGLLPLPWTDWNYYVEPLFPGASLGIATDINVIAGGFVLPGIVSTSMFIGSFAAYFVGNALLVKMGLFRDWIHGLNIMQTYQRSYLNFWINPIIGLGLVAGLYPLVKRPNTILNSVAGLFKTSSRWKEGRITVLRSPFIIFLIVATVLGISASILAPNFPIWLIFLLTIGWQLVLNLISARSLGVTGMPFDVPTVMGARLDTLAIIYAGGSKDPNIWFAPLYVGTGGSGWCQSFNVARLCETSPTVYVKAYFVALPIAWLSSFIFVQIYWRIAPIPSGVYPWPAVQWPIEAVQRAMLISGKLTLLNPQTLIGSALIGLVVQFLFDLIHFPFSFIAFSMGLATPLPSSFGIFLGWLIGRIVAHFLGKEWWDKYRFTIVAGFALGTGVVVTTSICVALLSKFMWALPY